MYELMFTHTLFFYTIQQMSYPLGLWRMTTKHGINSSAESLPEDFRNYRTNNVSEVPDFFKKHKRWVEIEKVAKEMDENHRELPGDAKARKVDLLIVLVTNFATDISLSRELEYKENGKLKQKCVEWLVSFLVNCCVENGYDDERIRALIMSTGGIIDQLPITGPPKWHHDPKLRPDFEATCAKTRGPMKEIMSDLLDECPRVQDRSAVFMVLGGPAHKEAIVGPDALSSGILPAEALSCTIQTIATHVEINDGKHYRAGTRTFCQGSCKDFPIFAR